MRKNIMAGALGLMLAGCAAFEFEVPNLTREKVEITEAEIAQAKEVVLRSLKDPESARFADNWYGTREPGQAAATAICGEVNARNSYGGYDGFSHVAVENGRAYFFTNRPAYGVPNDNIHVVNLCTPIN
jgi:hypothetical protein